MAAWQTALKKQPLTGNTMPRFGGIATMMRLPQAAYPVGLDVAFTCKVVRASICKSKSMALFL
jgi:hypothetical protein